MRDSGVKRSTFYELMGNGQFPEPVRFNRVLTWRDSDIQDWIDRQRGGCAGHGRQVQAGQMPQYEDAPADRHGRQVGTVEHPGALCNDGSKAAACSQCHTAHLVAITRRQCIRKLPDGERCPNVLPLGTTRLVCKA